MADPTPLARLRALALLDRERARSELHDAVSSTGSVPAAALRLGVPLRTLYRLLSQLDIRAPHRGQGRPRKVATSVS